MGLMNGVSGIFGLKGSEERQKADSREEINFMDALNANATCKVHLQNLFSSKSLEQLDPALISRDDLCILGKWIHGPAFKHFQMSPMYYQLRTQHAQAHFIAGNVIQHVKDNNRVAAEDLMEGKYKEASRKVLKALTELNQSVKV